MMTGIGEKRPPAGRLCGGPERHCYFRQIRLAQVRFGGWLSAQAGCQEREENLTLLTRDGIA